MQPPPTSIRPYEETDLDAVLAVWEAASAVGHPFLDRDFLDRERQLIATEHLPVAETWVWQEGNSIVGFIALLGEEIGAIFVHPDHHRRGIGRALVDHARTLHGHLEVEVFEANSVGRDFYRRCGFVLAERKEDERTGRTLLRLELPPV